MATDAGNKEVGHPPPTPSRNFGQLPALSVSDDFDDPLPQVEIDAWEDSNASAQDDGAEGEK
ncbi:hypothetical protein [Mycolicibacterium pyrenivorans]|uniref:hypothetical protein n=1 Tax=Mycolicibacterium pyrenivorans TaxID=187102 RepID=UPI000A5DB64D|nr:hypothetical protein [Mycolicibacterium pyrenivorans]MCV7152608.1 hypothetical protein [Mycolicibacterium pyrenivorans]